MYRYSSLTASRKAMGIKSPKARLKELTPIVGRFITRLPEKQRRRIEKTLPPLEGYR